MSEEQAQQLTMKSNLCFSCKQKLDNHSKDELLECAVKIVKEVSEN